MLAFSVAGGEKSYGGHTVFAGLSWDVRDGDVIGLVGPNGSGKSTLLRCIAGLEPLDAGQITPRRGLTIGYLPQEPDLDAGQSPLDAVIGAHARLHALRAEAAALEARMGDPAVYEDASRLDAVLERHATALGALALLDDATFESRCETALLDLGLDAEDILGTCGALSGGQRKLVGLARILVQRPDVLLLDEPDNHLDFVAKGRLERTVAAFPGAVIIVSHDRHLLDVLATGIAELQLAGRHPGRPQLTTFAGNYSEFAFEQRLALERQQRDYVLQQREVARLEHSIERLKVFSRGGANEKFVRRWQSMQKRLDRLDRVERPILEPQRMRMALRAERGSQRAVELTGIEKAYGDAEVLRGVDLLVRHGERVGVVGPNGAGKSVLGRCILGIESPDAGTVRVGPSNTIAFYAQEHETLDLDRTAIEEIRRVAPLSEGEVVAHLAKFLFDYDLARQRVGDLSGGQKSRLQLARIVLEGANILLLDEPTNNLDIASAEQLEEALADYAGTLICISHDRYFLDRAVDRVVELDGGRLRSYEGGFAEYAAARAGD